MEAIVFSVIFEGIVPRLIDNLRRSVACKIECMKLEVLVANNKDVLERLAKGLHRSKGLGQGCIAVEQWCLDMKERLVRANELVHRFQSGSKPYNLIFSASLGGEIEEIRTGIEVKLNHSTSLELLLQLSAQCADGMQQCHSTAALQHGHSMATQHGDCMVQTTFHVDPLKHSASMSHLHTMHTSCRCNQHYHEVSPSMHLNPSVHINPYGWHSVWNAPGTSHFHPEVDTSTVYYDRRHSELPVVGFNQWLNEVDDIEARAEETREFHRRNSTGSFSYYPPPPY